MRRGADAPVTLPRPEVPALSLSDALELTILIARKDPRRHQRVAARWLLRYLEEHPEATIDEGRASTRIMGGRPRTPGAHFLSSSRTPG
jgi:hypothetical protein